MAVLTVIAPGGAVAVPDAELRAATVERADMRAGANPLAYTVGWQDGGRRHRKAFRADQVEPADPQNPPPRLTVIAPGTAVAVAAMTPPLRNAAVERVEVRADDPTADAQVTYFLTWRPDDAAPVRRCGFRGPQVTERPGAPAALAPRGRLADLGQQFAAAAAEGD